MTDVRHRRLEQYEAKAAEYEMRAQVATDPSKRQEYERLAAHYRYLAVSFRLAMVMHDTASAKLTLH